MSRLKNFTRSLLSSYALLGVNVFYTLASVPLALKYLTKAEFGLWGVTLQIAGYISLVDLGMGSSISRILIDHKDDRASGRYGGAVKSGFLVGLVQSLIILAVGLGLVWFMAGWLLVPQELSRQFFWLMIGQIFLTAATFLSRMFNQLLFAWQRIDISNYSGIAQLIIGIGVLWIGFYFGLGVFSLLAGFMAGWLGGTAICFFACLHLGFWPRTGEWGHASRVQFRELFNYGADIFLISIGTQLIMSSQTVLVSRQLGMEAAALWSVMTKAFTVISQIVFRVVGNAMPAFAEMHVRKENDRMWSRYRAMFITVSVLAGYCGVLFAACNGPFVTVWMHGQFSWPAINNALLAAWLCGDDRAVLPQLAHHVSQRNPGVEICLPGRRRCLHRRFGGDPSINRVDRDVALLFIGNRLAYRRDGNLAGVPVVGGKHETPAMGLAVATISRAGRHGALLAGHRMDVARRSRLEPIGY